MDQLILSNKLFNLFDALGFQFIKKEDSIIEKRMYTKQHNMVVKNIHVSDDMFFNDTYFNIMDNQVWRFSITKNLLQLCDGYNFMVNILLNDEQLIIAMNVLY